MLTPLALLLLFGIVLTVLFVWISGFTFVEKVFVPLFALTSMCQVVD